MQRLPELISIIVKAGLSAPSADNSQPWRFIWDGSCLTLKYDDRQQASRVFNASSPATLITLGAVAENLIAVSLALKASVTWSFCFDESQGGISFKGFFKDLHYTHGNDLLQLPLFKRHTNRFPYLTKSIDAHFLAELEVLAQGSASIKLFYEKRHCNEISKLIKLASAMRFRSQKLHEWFVASLRFSPSEVLQGNGLDVATLPLPPGGRSLLKLISPWERMRRFNRLGLHKIFAAIEGRPVARGPVMIAIIAPCNRQGMLSAGQLMEKIWCKLNSVGIAVHPYYVISDQLLRLRERTLPEEFVPNAQKLELMTSKLLGEDAEKLQMLLRVGYPKQQAPRSHRMKVNEVLFAE